LCLLLALQIISTAAEMVSIGSIIPFLTVILNPKSIESNKYAKIIINTINNQSEIDLVLFITVFFVLVVFLSGVIKMLQVFVGAKVAFSIGNETSTCIYRNILRESYNYHYGKNTSDLIDVVVNKAASVIYDALLPFIVCISSLLSILGIIAILYYIDSQVTIIIVVYGSIFYISAMSYASKTLAKNGNKINEHSVKIIKILQEGFGAIRHILIDKTEDFYCEVFKNTDKEFRSAQASTYYIGILPRYLIETVGLIMIVILAYYLSYSNHSIALGLPVLAAVALGVQKIMPLMHQLFHSLASIRSGQDSLEHALSILDKSNNFENKLNLVKDIKFEDKIEFKNIYFRYDENSNYVINNFNCVIKKGMRVGIVGKSGSGKSTLVDLLLGLLIPTEGYILVDNLVLNINNIQAWQKHLAHVDQNLYILEENIIKNICLSDPFNKVDKVRLDQAIDLSNLRNEIDTGVIALNLSVGENGVLLSGGQRQRIGIARSLYKNGDVIIFDEATSALDADTENEIMKTIDCLSKNMTLFIISHKESMLNNCDIIIRMMSNGNYQVKVN